MADYKLTNNNSIIRIADEALIPNDLDNRDFIQYQAWVDLGNVADSADSIDPWINVRLIRDQLLSSCDWTQLADSPLSTEVKASWSSYRQTLRNIPQDYQNVSDIIWPTKPN